MLGEDTGETVGRHGADSILVHKPVQDARARLVVKRCLDAFVSACALVALAPFMCGIAAGAALAGGRPFERVAHIGQGGRSIYLLRFGPHVRSGPLGTFLFESGLGDMPRLFNVLRGDLALVGPRPRHTGMAGRAGAQTAMRPGLLSPGAAFATASARAEAERDYVENYTLAHDARVILAQIRRLRA